MTASFLGVPAGIPRREIRYRPVSARETPTFRMNYPLGGGETAKTWVRRCFIGGQEARGHQQVSTTLGSEAISSPFRDDTELVKRTPPSSTPLRSMKRAVGYASRQIVERQSGAGRSLVRGMPPSQELVSRVLGHKDLWVCCL